MENRVSTSKSCRRTIARPGQHSNIYSKRWKLSIPMLASLLAHSPALSTAAFIATTAASKGRAPSQARIVQSLGLVPLSRFAGDLSFFSEPDDYRLSIDGDGSFEDGGCIYHLALVEGEDLPDLCRFIVTTFGADAISLSQDMSSLERMFMSPAAELLNGYSGLVAFSEVFSGTNQRLSKRFQKIDISRPFIQGLQRKEAIESIEKDSLVLALARRKEDQGSRIEVIASIELRLQPCDAKIPFSLPWMDKIERKLAASIGLGEGSARDLQPYLSNLCVDEKYRGKKIGKALVRCVENIAATNWGYNRMYLHVDEENVAALSLYQGEGYRDVGHRWNPFWAGDAAKIGYYVKTMHKSN